MTRTEFIFWLVIVVPPVGLIGYVIWHYLREARRHAAVVGFMAVGRGDDELVSDRRFTPDEIYRQNEGRG